MVSPLKDAKLLAEAAERGRLKATAERDALAARVAEITKDRDDCLAAREHYAGLYGETLSRVAELVEALKHARQFIMNGIDLGFIRMPDHDTPDSAHDTLPIIDAALAKSAKESGHD